MNNEQKTCQNCKSDFVIEPEDFEFYSKIKVPLPTWCFTCRVARRLVTRNERALFKVKSATSGKEILSMFPMNSGFKVCEKDYWWSDDWDAADQGKSYDFSKPFFEQFSGLLRSVLWFNLSVENAVNSEYCNNVINLKNCYLVFDSGYCEDCTYCVGINSSKSSLDLADCAFCEQSYHSFYCHKSAKMFFSVNCENCLDVWFSKDCIGCVNCFGCCGLRNKSYRIFN